MAYWSRFEEARADGTDSRLSLEDAKEAVVAADAALPRNASDRTRLLLRRYYAAFGIDKEMEDTHRLAIEAAVEAARAACEGGEPSAALRALGQVRRVRDEASTPSMHAPAA